MSLFNAQYSTFKQLLTIVNFQVSMDDKKKINKNLSQPILLWVKYDIIDWFRFKSGSILTTNFPRKNFYGIHFLINTKITVWQSLAAAFFLSFTIHGMKNHDLTMAPKVIFKCSQFRRGRLQKQALFIRFPRLIFVGPG